MESNDQWRDQWHEAEQSRAVTALWFEIFEREVPCIYYVWESQIFDGKDKKSFQRPRENYFEFSGEQGVLDWNGWDGYTPFVMI